MYPYRETRSECHGSTGLFGLLAKPSSSVTGLKEEERRQLYTVLQASIPDNSEILAVAAVERQRIVQVKQRERPDQGSFLHGLLVLGCTPFEGTHWLRLTDCDQNICWHYNMHVGFTFQRGARREYTLAHGGRKFHLQFYESSDSEVFEHEVHKAKQSQTNAKPLPPVPVEEKHEKKHAKKHRKKFPFTSTKKKLSKFSTDLISAPVPESFEHVGSLGYDSDGNTVSSGHVSADSIDTFENMQFRDEYAELIQDRYRPTTDLQRSASDSPAGPSMIPEAPTIAYSVTASARFSDKPRYWV